MPRPPAPGQPRSVTVSKALSYLLRHGAAKERIPMDAHGYVNVAHLLKWHKLRALNVDLAEICDAVRDNEKQRFSLKYTSPGTESEPDTPPDDSSPQPAPSTTTTALSHYARDPNPSHYLIRASQGHTLTTLSSAAYLTHLSLTSPDLPSTCVHGTFYSAWRLILASGSLKPMGRTHVHFATGPALEQVLPASAAAGSPPVHGPTEVVISGMRSGASILVYVSLRRALEAGVPFWRSENGVLLTEGVAGSDETRAAGDAGAAAETANGKDAEPAHATPGTAAGGVRLLPLRFVDVVVEVKAGLGVVWRRGEGVVRELPAELAGRGAPRGKGRGGGGRGRGKGGGEREPGQGPSGGAKSRLNVERDDDLG